MYLKLKTSVLIALISLAIGCEQIAQVGKVETREIPTPTHALPATPDAPKRASESGVKPIIPRPAATAKPADTPKPVSTPLAVLPSYTPEPTATVAPRPTVLPIDSAMAKEKREEYITRCKHWFLRNREPILYSKFEKLDPYNMTDLERVLWGSVIVNENFVTDIGNYYTFSDDTIFQGFHVEWCQDYWSESLSSKNANKRNHPTLYISCLYRAADAGSSEQGDMEYAFENYESEGMSEVIVNQYARILNWVEIDGDTLLKLDPKPKDIIQMIWDRPDDGPSRYRDENKVSKWPLSSAKHEDIEWWHIEKVWNGNWNRSCKSYYPQLFFGRWVPLDHLASSNETLGELLERLEEQKSDDWPDWVDGPNRDILIRLE